MSLYPFFHPRPYSHLGDLLSRQFSPFFDHLQSTDPSSDIVNNDEKFGINLNVAQFKPDELKINVNGRKLTIQGEQEVKNEHGYSKKSFCRIILLPEDVDVSEVVSNLTEDGQLSIEAPKKETIQGRAIPIQQAKPSQ